MADRTSSSRPTAGASGASPASAANGKPSAASSDRGGPETKVASKAPATSTTAPASTSSAAPPTSEGKLSGKEAKLAKQAEKQARRAQEKAAKGLPAVPSGAGPATPNTGPRNDASTPVLSRAGSGTGNSREAQKPRPTDGQRGGPQQGGRRQSQSQNARPLAIRRRGSANAPTPASNAVQTKDEHKKAPKKPAKQVGLFGHLYGQARRTTIEGVSKEVHPAVLSLGFQMSNYVITGSNARCVAMLLAFKSAISDYTTPPTTSLARHLTSHYLSPQIDYLKSHRPISVGMGNAIRWLKDYIIQIDPDVPENVAKADIADAIDTFIRERITVADTAIAGVASAKIRPGAKIVTFAKSSIVEQTLLQAASDGVKFSVTCLDSRPLFEGKNLVRSLCQAGIRCTYALLPAAAHVLADADLVLLGAHAMMANGRLYSRVGTAGVALLAKSGRDVPVIVCCESLKFTDRVTLDSIVLNEVAPSEELVSDDRLSSPAATSNSGAGARLHGWKDVQGLQLLNIMYDVTPAEYIDMVITEYGSLPPSSVPVVHRISTERDVRA